MPEKARRWYVRRVEDFLKEVRPESLSRLTEGEVTGYLQKVSSRSGLVDWQFRQLVEALQLFLVDLAQVHAGKEIDWNYWKAGGTPLAADHPTLAKSQAPEARVQRLAGGPTFSRAAGSCPLLETLARTIRAMQYSIRTESPMAIGPTVFAPSAAIGRPNPWVSRMCNGS